MMHTLFNFFFLKITQLAHDKALKGIEQPSCKNNITFHTDKHTLSVFISPSFATAKLTYSIAKIKFNVIRVLSRAFMDYSCFLFKRCNISFANLIGSHQ